MPALGLLHRQAQHCAADGVSRCANARSQAGSALELQTVQLRVYICKGTITSTMAVFSGWSLCMEGRGVQTWQTGN